MRLWFAFLATVLASVGFAACGGASGSGSTLRVSSSEESYVIGDADDDDHNYGDEPEDNDDGKVRDYGQAGTAAEARAITSVLKRYYAAAAAGDGAAACLLIDSRLAKSLDLEAFLPKQYRPAPGSSVFRDKECAQVESLLFELNRKQLSIESETLVLTSVRVDGDHALAVMRFRTMGERTIDLQKEDNVWKVDALIDGVVL